MNVDDPYFQDLLKLMLDYEDFIQEDNDIQEALQKFIVKAIQTGQDASDDDIFKFEKFLKEKIEKFVKEKAN